VTRPAFASLGVLLAYGLAFAAVALGQSPLAADDHPGQFFRLWHGLTRGLAPWTWNPDWWMGTAELQHYPPGFVYVGAAIHVLTLGSLPTATLYQTLLWVIWLAPGVAALILLARLVPDPWFALPGAFLVLTFSAEIMSGVEGGLRIGMIAARLGWALLPLLAFGLVGWIERGGSRPALAALALAAIVLCHPAHAPAAIVLLVLAALVGVGSFPYRLFQAGWVALTAAALTAFWWLPLLAHLGESRPLAWGEPAAVVLRRLVASGPLPGVLLILAGTAALVRRDRVAIVLTAAIPAMLGVIALDPSIRLPANRLLDSLVMLGLLAAGVGLGRSLGALAHLRAFPAPAGAIAATLAVAGLALAGGRVLALWPDRAQWPSQADVERRLRVEDLWQALRAGPAGRVLFVRSSLPLDPLPAGATERAPWYRPHSHVTALAPLYVGRPIVNGTFTHPSAMAGLAYTGSPDRTPIRRLVEQLDGQELFGRPLHRLDTATLDGYLSLFGVSTVVMLEEDIGRFPALEDHADFTRSVVSPHVVFQRLWAVPTPEAVGPGRWRVVLSGAPGDWVSARVSFSALWRAEDDGGRLPVRRGTLGDLEVRVATPGAPVDLVYRDGWPEHLGLVLSGLGLLGWAAPWLAPRRRRRH
jgi:hypothetical protein